ncbi:MAG: segregation/condensation protein A [Gammaproteobacteria bacterium]|nr:segregation/condensation protein A [Gammaproteobacteria bacterium]NIM71619.1 segregation/condensation protein A [Gammaproteobacteria bacterium]NIN37167.1 segregation/condensation protein A [Gammaproteobacteria bacterium]NIO23359.1 segregation/condensation protein A [Gammaproteobacteria bacterium]NIO63987.1 segregation/condensation protein A [Gammaproteobacteria bacterium]
MIDSDGDTRSGIDSEDTTLASEPRQEELPFAVVEGVPMTELPKDLYIPPNALEIFLEAFEGPLDLLLYLIKRQNLDILDIPIAEITRQYMEYVDLMKDLRLELAAEYLVMAAMLTEIKSRMLLPRPEAEFEEEGDPRAELVRRLQEYERFKQAAEDLEGLPRVGRDVLVTEADTPHVKIVKPQPTVRIEDLVMALADVFERARMYSHHHIQSEPLSVRERMSSILAAVGHDHYTEFTSLFTVEEGRRGVIVTLLAVLELVREMLIELVQAKPLGPIHVRAHTS